MADLPHTHTSEPSAPCLACDVDNTRWMLNLCVPADDGLNAAANTAFGRIAAALAAAPQPVKAEELAHLEEGARLALDFIHDMAGNPTPSQWSWMQHEHERRRQAELEQGQKSDG